MSVFAGNAPATVLDVVEAAIARAPGGAIVSAAQDQAEAGRRQASSLFAAAPALVARHETDAIGASDGFREWEFGVEAPVWLPGQKASRRQVADAIGQQGAGFEAYRRWQVAGAVREQLWAVLIAHERQALAQAATTGANELHRLVERRIRAGEIARVEQNLAAKEVLQRQSEAEQAQSDAAIAERNYAYLTGTSLLPAAPRERPPADAQALKLDAAHPELALAQAELDLARAGLKRARSERWSQPAIYVGGLQTRDSRASSQDGSVALELRVPIGLDSQVNPRLTEAQRAVTEAEAALARLRRNLTTTLRQREAELLSKQKQVRLAREQRQLAEEGLRLGQRAFELGETDLFKLLATRQQAIEARRAFRIGRLESSRAIARLNQAAGVLPQ